MLIESNQRQLGECLRESVTDQAEPTDHVLSIMR
jgi:hypothetical protein